MSFYGESKSSLQLSVCFLLLFFIIQGAKRGALIVALVGCSVFIYYLLSSVDPKKRVQSFLVALIGIGLFSIYVYDFYISNEFLVNRMQKISDGGSGRDLIYLNLLNNWYESNSVINYLFGFGFVSTIKYSGSGHLAHNDWLELLTNFGLIGISIYSLVFYAALRFIYDPGVKKEHRLIMLAIVSMWFLHTLFFYALHIKFNSLYVYFIRLFVWSPALQKRYIQSVNFKRDE